jgi:CheY-like chemotaxis protein
VSRTYKDYPILVIDDEEDFLAVFKRLGEKYRLDTEKYPSEALKKIEKGNYCIIISDNKMRHSAQMPEDEQAGVNLLKRIRTIDDHPLRVLATGWSKEGIKPSLSTQSDVNILIDKLDVITDEEWDETLARILTSHLRAHSPNN